MFCKNCGAQISEGKKFCPNCGQSISATSNNQQSEQGTSATSQVNSNATQNANASVKTVKAKSSMPAVPIIIALVAVILVGGFCVYKFVLNKKPAPATAADYYEETKPSIEQPTKEVVQDGWVGNYFYKNGNIVYNAVVGDYYVGDDGQYVMNRWVGNSYYGADGKKVKNAWIDDYYLDGNGNYAVSQWIGNYYVDASGKKLRNATTPDGYYVGADGVYVPQTVTPTQATTQVIIQPSTEIAPSETIEKKDEELYISATKKITDEIYDDDDNKCNISYIKPIFSGAEPDEVTTVNDLIEEDMMNELAEALESIAAKYEKYPKTIAVTKAEMTSLSSVRMRVTLTGKVTPRSGSSKSLKFRFSFDRDSGDMEFENLSD